MPYLKEFNLELPKLFIFYLGGNTERNQIEMHDVAFVVAKTDEEVSEKLRKKWFGTEKSLHVDSWFIAEAVDGFKVELLEERPAVSEMQLYFVNLGYYKKGVFGELHFMKLTAASSKLEAIENVKNECAQACEMLHSDNVYDLDDCIHLEEVDRYFVGLTFTGEEQTIDPINGYQRLRSFESSGRNL